MDKSAQSSSVGVVETHIVDIGLPAEGLVLKNGKSLAELQVAYETYGKLSPTKDNVVFICHALTGDAHVAGIHDESDPKPGWWDEMVGSGKGIDTDHYHVICANVLGGCSGTTGPASINTATQKPYGSSFPEISITDMVNVHKLLLDHLGIERLAGVIGGSLGGMQALEWAIRYPHSVERCICVASGASLSAQALAFDAVARDAIESDPDWAGGDYYDKDAKPHWGLAHARKIAHITYLSPEIMQEKFGREIKEGEQADKQTFQIESYLDHQGKKFVERFDANSYLRLARAVDSYDLANEHGSLEKAFSDVTARFLIVGLSSDWLFPPEQSAELASALIRCRKRVSCCTLSAPQGHDAFLVDIKNLAETLRAFLPWVGLSDENARCVGGKRNGADIARFNIIVDAVAKGSRVLDLGCGGGELLTLLAAKKDTLGFGLDIDLSHVIHTIDRGHDIVQGDLDGGLSIIPDDSYDYAILSSTLQVVKRPALVLREMLRVAREGIVTFPNFAHWKNRISIGIYGTMPKSSALPHEWYDTPNIRLSTRNDFIQLCKREEIDILDMVCLPDDSFLSRILISCGRYNLGAARVVARIACGKRGE